MASMKPNHVVVMAFPYGTHAIPLFNVVRRFAIQAPSLTFSFFSTSKSNQSVFGTSSPNDIPRNIKPYNVDDGESFTGHPKNEVFSFIKSMVEKFKNGVDSVYGGHDKMIKCFISDTFLYFVSDMADQMGVPWVSFWAGGPCSLSAHFHTDLIRLSIPLGPNEIEGREEEPMDFVPGLSFVKIGDLPDGVLFGGWESELAVMLHKTGLALPRAAATTMNSFAELDLPTLEYLKSESVKCLPMGPFTLTSQNLSHAHDDPHGCLTWLDKQNPTSVAYISFGTMSTPPPHELAALAEGLEESGVPFIWSLKDHLVSQLPNGFLERTRNRGFTAPWTPQERILKHNAVGVFVTHCGWNSVMESIMAGVPMICRPCFGDQRINCRLVSDVWGIGTRVKDGVFTKDETMKCLDMIFSEEKLREKVGALRGFAKHAVGPNGSSTKNVNTLAEIVCKD
ncbi:hypothetical protein C5167_023621 [Papaver somniferum]|uniref:Glycosyltransferase n=1 Tax=Papaver somniferum TaxID=3469 RepID=A0A4Y7JPD9_PAPSO|nr:anthocyanidin 3-O-glucosyltransferase 7-like [Papaver somniferum]RZC61821.1 hypothetical protein C5167_023621 [Papaver somniferum]